MPSRLAGGTDILGSMQTPSEARIGQLFMESKAAAEAKDWQKSELLNRQLLEMLAGRKDATFDDLITVARRYLSSIVDFDIYLNKDNQGQRAIFQKQVDDFRNFISKNLRLSSSLGEIEKELIELQLYIAMPRSDTLSKSARALRRIGRPDLAVELCNLQLSKTRLNYYSRIARSWALGDLGDYDKAIEDAEIALKHNPNRDQNYPQVAMSRAHRLRFTKNGDLDDGETALNFAEEALRLKRNFAAAEAYVCISRKLKVNNNVVERLIQEFPKLVQYVDKAAAESAWNITTRQDSEVDTTIEIDDIEDFEDEQVEAENEFDESHSDYYEDYLPEYSESLQNPRSPHLEP